MAFTTDLGNARDDLLTQGFVHLEHVLDAAFVDLLRQIDEQIDGDAAAEVGDWHIPGKKRQYLFDFPNVAFLDAFRTGIATITGLDPDRITIGERHVKVYDDQAPDFSAPHLDRKAAVFTIGFPIRIPEKSRVCFFPHFPRDENPSERAVFAELPAGTDVEDLYADPRVAKYRGEIGDMLIFYGSKVYHERMYPAGARILYIKVNADGSDPLGEHASLMAGLEDRVPEPA